MTADKTDSKKDLVIDFDPKSSQNADLDFINLLSGQEKTHQEPLEVAASGSLDLSFVIPPKAAAVEKSPWQKALAEFPQSDKSDDEDPHQYPRDLVQKEIINNPPLSENEEKDLKAWRQFPGLDEGSTGARNLKLKELFVPAQMTLDEATTLRSWEEFPNPDKGLDFARSLRVLEGQEILDAEGQSKLEAWRSFSNPDPRYDRARELVQKQADNSRDKPLSQNERAELASWIEFPELHNRSSSLRELAAKQYLYGEDPEKGLKPPEVAKLIAWSEFPDRDPHFDRIRNLAQIHILSNYGEGPPLSSTNKAELSAWATFSNPDQKFDKARELLVRDELKLPLSDKDHDQINQALFEEAKSHELSASKSKLAPNYRSQYHPAKNTPTEPNPKHTLPPQRGAC